MRWLTTLLMVLVTSGSSAGQTARVEPDHVFVVVSPGGELEAEALRALGFSVDPGVMTHSGGGTASRSAVFENFYLELVWVDSTAGLTETSRERFADMQRAAAWRSTGASPFGLGLRKMDGPDDYGVPTMSYTDAWMLEGTSITLLKQPGEPRAFDIFVVPSYMALPAWIDQVRELTLHANGARRLSALEIQGPATHRPLATRALSLPTLRVTDASESLLVLDLDDRVAGETYDLRPLMPVVIRR